MLKRLAGLIGFFFFWLIAAFALPIVFWVVSGLILTLVVIYVIRTKKFGGGAPFFTGVGVLTALLATGGFFAGGGEPTERGTEVAAEADGDVAEDEAEKDAAVAKDGDEDQDAGDEDQDGGEAAAGVDAKTALKNVIAFSKNKKSCKSLEAIAAAWRDLSSIPAEAPEHGKALKLAKMVEGCRKQAVGALTKTATAARVKGRMAMMKTLKADLGAKGLKGAPAPAGKAKEKLTIKLQKATEEQIAELTENGVVEEDTFLGRLQAAGFAEVKVSSGKLNKTFPLTPTPDTADATAQAAALGLDQPFVLP